MQFMNVLVANLSIECEYIRDELLQIKKVKGENARLRYFSANWAQH